MGIGNTALAPDLTNLELGELDALAQQSERARHVLAIYGSVGGNPKYWEHMSTENRIRVLLVDLRQLAAEKGVDIKELI